MFFHRLPNVRVPENFWSPSFDFLALLPSPGAEENLAVRGQGEAPDFDPVLPLAASRDSSHILRPKLAR